MFEKCVCVISVTCVNHMITESTAPYSRQEVNTEDKDSKKDEDQEKVDEVVEEEAATPEENVGHMTLVVMVTPSWLSW